MQNIKIDKRHISAAPPIEIPIIAPGDRVPDGALVFVVG